jgi:hypothetical protein
MPFPADNSRQKTYARVRARVVYACARVALCACVAGAYAREADAGTFSRIKTPGELTSIWYTGTIEPGDAAKLERVIASRWHSRGVTTQRIWVNLDGGQVVESLKVADVMIKYNMDIVVGRKAACISACLNLYVGAVKRWFTSTSYVGVHAALDHGFASANGTGQETLGSRSATLALAQIWATHNVPSNVIVKMLSTDGHDITWLTANDLVENNWSTIIE